MEKMAQRMQLLAASIIAIGNKDVRNRLNSLRDKQTRSVKKTQDKMTKITLGIIGGVTW